MLTSATGASSPAEAGFTLVELMVVLVVMGLIAGAVVLTVPDGRPRLADEAERLAARLVMAREEAVITNKSVDVAFTSRGYAFRKLVGGTWTPLAGASFEAIAWPEGVTAEVETGDGREGLRFSSDGAAGAGKVTLNAEARQVAVTVDEAGNVRVDAPAS